MLILYCRKKKTDSDSSNGTTTYATTTEIIYGTPKPRPEYVYGTLKRYVDCRNCRVQCLYGRFLNCIIQYFKNKRNIFDKSIFNSANFTESDMEYTYLASVKLFYNTSDIVSQINKKLCLFR